MTTIQRLSFWGFFAFLLLPFFAATPVNAQSIAFKQAVAEAAAGDRDGAPHGWYGHIGDAELDHLCQSTGV